MYNEKDAIQRMLNESKRQYQKIVKTQPARRMKSDENGIVLDRNNPDDKEWFDDDKVE